MTGSSSERGTTLLEAIVAAGLLVTLVSGVASLLVSARQAEVLAARTTAATRAAEARLESLRAETFSFTLGGTPIDASSLAPSPPDALRRSIPGFFDGVDRHGRALEASEADSAALLRRWTITPIAATSPGAIAIEVCVFAPPAVPDAHPLVCLSTIRSRQP